MQARILGGLLIAFLATASPAWSEETVKIGFNYPRTGPYFAQGLDQLRAATLAVKEINGKGGIDGKQIELVIRDSKSQADVTKVNVTELIDKEGVKMVFGGSATSVALAASDVCQKKNIPFFGTLTYGNDLTGKDAHRTTFRECYNGWMGAKTLSRYLNKQYPKKKYYYVTADYAWGWTTESSMRHFTDSADTSIHKGVKTPFPNAGSDDFKKALKGAEDEKPDVLVLVLFGQDMVTAINVAAGWGMKSRMHIVVPNLTLGMAELAGPENMEGIVGAIPWTAQIPYSHNYPRGKEFVERFSAEYGRLPDTSGASAYTILYEYKGAVERGHSFDTASVIKQLENHEYTLLKDKQVWREFDHQSVQTTYAVKCRTADKVRASKYKLDYFEIIDSLPGEEAAMTLKEWQEERRDAKRPLKLEKFASE